MADEPIDATLRRMREEWDQRARENARYFVATQRTDWTDEEFYASGEAEINQQIRNDVENICQGRDPAQMRVLEIGCGAGRVTRALAGFFGEVHAVDVSGEMVERARQAVAGKDNAFIYQNNGMDLSVLPDLSFDFAFSVIVFQHIPRMDVVENYFREVHRLLRPGSLFKLQVQGRPKPPLPEPEPEPSDTPLPLHWRITGRIPLPIRERYLRPIRKRLLPDPPPPPPPVEKPPDTWIGLMFTPEEAAGLAERCGFDLRHQQGVGGQFYWWWCFKR